jgi:hypothetical protein
VFLKGQEPAPLKKPVLAAQLATMLLWPPALLASSHQELIDLGTALTPILPLAVAAEQAVAGARREEAARELAAVNEQDKVNRDKKKALEKELAKKK